MTRKPVWIYESGAIKLLEQVEGGAYIFQGLAADFKRNENGRVYSKDDYISHFSYLTPKIEEGALWGELDHPERYNVLVKEASHIVKDLRYDESSDTVIIKIELFDNEKGNHVKGMVAKGAPVYISSRASGFIDEDGNVVLERIYTYDIVNEPGFKNAKLKRLNESLHIPADSLIEVYEMKTINTEENNNKSSNMNPKDKSTTTPKKEGEAVNIEEAFNEYTEKTTQMFTQMQTGLDEVRKLMKEKNAANPEAIDENIMTQIDEVRSNFNTAMEQFESYTTEFDGYKGKIDESSKLLEKMNASINGIMKWAVAMEKKHESVNTRNEKLVEHVNLITGIMNENVGEISEFKTKITEHVNLISNLVNENLEEVEGNVNKLKEYHDLAATEINNLQEITESKVVPHLNMVTESVNTLLTDTEGTGKKVADVIKHVNTVSTVANENLVANASFGIIEVSGSVDEGFTGDITVDDVPCGKLKFDKKGYTVTVDEGYKQVEKEIINSTKLKEVFESTYFQAYGIAYDLVESIKKNDPKHTSKMVDQAIENAKNKNAKGQTSAFESKYPFLKVIKPDARKQFENLSEAKQIRVAQVITDKTLLRSAEIENAITVVEGMQDDMLQLVNHLTGDQVTRWERLDEERKDMVYSMFTMRNINDKLTFDSFFESLDWRNKVIEPLNQKSSDVSESAHSTVDETDEYANRMLGL